MRVLWRGGLCPCAAVVVSAAVVVLGTAPAGASTSTGASTKTGVAPPAEVLSNYETSTGHTLDRDCGFSAPVAGPAGRRDDRPGPQDLWLFCDTINYDAAGNITEAVLGSDTAAEAPLVPGQVPTDLSELPTPPQPASLPDDNGPQPFLPLPRGVTLPGSSAPCVGTNASPDGVYGAQSPGTYPASWFTGVTPAHVPGAPGDVLISFNNYCVDSETGNINTLFTDEGFGVVLYNPVTNQLGKPEYVFSTTGGQDLPLSEQLGSPLFYGGFLYLFGSTCSSSAFGVCTAGQVFLARSPALPFGSGTAASYQFWTGNGWSSDYADATSVVPGAAPLGVSAGNYFADGHGLDLVVETNVGGGFQVWTAVSPTGPWQLRQSDQVPSACSGGEFGCYALVGHPEISTPGELMVSYLDPAGLGHLHLAAFPWQPVPSNVP